MEQLSVSGLHWSYDHFLDVHKFTDSIFSREEKAIELYKQLKAKCKS